LYGLFLFVRVVRVVRGSWNSKGVSLVILTAKVCRPVFPRSYRSRCSRFMKLKQSVRNNFNRERRENREQKKEASPGTLDLTKKGVSLVDLKRFEEESKERFSLPSRVGTRAVKEEEALVRAVRVVRGS